MVRIGEAVMVPSLCDVSLATAVAERAAVAVHFWAPWCMPCKITAAGMETLAEEFAGRVFFGKVDVDRMSGAAKAMSVSAVPTVVLFRDGEVAARCMGARDADALRDFLDRNLPVR